jgi:putative tryptophan/tyrosine transport system substrate-binding protein
MRRRDLITLFGGTAVAWPLVARAQQPDRLRRIGILLMGNAEAASLRTELRESLRKSGYVEGQNLQFEVRSADGKLDLLPRLATELVATKVDVIVAQFTPSALAAKRTTTEIPIVFFAGDPVETGIVPSLARPGGNLTGLAIMGAELQTKCVELLRDMLPSVHRVAALGYATDPFSKQFVDLIQKAGRTTGIEINPLMMLNGPQEIGGAFEAMEQAHAEGVVLQGPFSTKQVADLALKHRLASATNFRSFPEVGGLMSYGYEGRALYRHIALLVQKVLQGSKPADMPVEQPTKFELVINLKTAKVLGIEVPLFFQQRADDVIE